MTERLRPVLGGVMLLYIGTGFSLFPRLIPIEFIPDSVFSVVGGVLIAAGLVVIMLVMPGSGFKRYFSTLLGVRSDGERDTDAIQHEILSVLYDVKNLRSAAPSPSGKLSKSVQDEILELYRQALDDKFSANISSQLKLLVSEQFKREVEFEAAKFLNDVNGRLQSASSTVSVRGFLNLVLGIAFAAGALYVLQQAIWLLTPERLNSLPMPTVIYLTATRVSLAIVIIFVSYFFLSLYRRSLEDAKFYQNEMTDISFRATALQLSYFAGDKEARSYVLTKLMESDRNRALAIPLSGSEGDNLGSELAKKLVDKLPGVKIS